MKKTTVLAILTLLTIFALPGAAKGIANGLPDVVVTNLEVGQNPAAVGDMVPVSFTVLNNGKKDLLTNCKIELNTNGAVKAFSCNGLKAGATITYTTSVSYTAPGNHVLKVMADPANLIRERDEYNNAKELTVVVKALPNIKVTDVHCLGGYCSNNGYGMEGDPVGFSWSAQNTGAAIEGITDIKVNVSLDEKVVYTQVYSTSSIPAGGYFSSGGFVPDLYYTPGFHTVSVSIDADNKIRETDETDNVGKFGIEVVPLPPLPSLPDISLSYGWVEIAGPDSIKVNDYLKNNGPGVLDHSVVLNYKTDATGEIVTIRTVTVNAILGSGEQMVISQSFNSSDIPNPFGYQHMWIEADPDNEITENDESNNVLIIPICISSGSLSCYPPSPGGVS